MSNVAAAYPVGFYRLTIRLEVRPHGVRSWEGAPCRSPATTMNDHTLPAYLAANPKMHGVLYLLVLFIVKFGALIGGGALVNPGP